MALTNYSKVLFLKEYDYGATSTPRWSTDLNILPSGYETRNANWITPLHEFDVAYTVQSEEMVTYIKKFNSQMRGPLISFKFKDWSDYKCLKEDGIINAPNNGLLTGLPYARLYKKYQIDPAFDYSYRRVQVIAKPSDEPFYADYELFSFYINDVLQSNITVDFDYGRVYFQKESEFTINNISNATNGIVTTSSNHSFLTNDKIFISGVVGGDNKVNNKLYTITKISDTSFALNVNTTNYGTLNTGLATKYPQSKTDVVRWEGHFYNRVRFSEDMMTITFDTFGSFSVPTKLVEINGDNE